MYIGNRNLFESHSNDYTWDKISVGGYLNNDGKIKEICKAIVIPQKPRAEILCFKIVA